ncbi:MAG: hypothetical protein C0424_03580 [Sphingobacteriaceae bacterium]|nr:hypothetical protein [Sphingobacteriaceae bacterium]
MRQVNGSLRQVGDVYCLWHRLCHAANNHKKPQIMKKSILLAACLGISLLANAQKPKPITSPFNGPRYLRAIESESPVMRQHSPLLRQAFSNQYIPDTAFYHGWDDPNQSYFLHTKAHFTYGHGASLRRIDYYEVGNFGWEISQSDTFYYNTTNKLTAMETGVAGSPEFRMEINYGQGGIITGRHYMVTGGPNAANNGWETVLGDSLEIHTWQNGRPASFTLHAREPFGSGWMPMFRISQITYNAQGVPIAMGLEGHTGIGYAPMELYTNMSWGFGFGDWSQACGMTNSIEERYSILPQQRHFLKQPTAFVVQKQVSGSLVDYSRANQSSQNGFINQVLFEEKQGNTWVAIARDSYTYVSGQLASLTSEEHNGNQLAFTSRWVYAYGAQYLQEQRTELWDAAITAWVIDEAFSYRLRMLQSRPDSLETLVYDPSTNAYVSGQLATFSYNTAASTRPEKVLSLEVWPNPAQEQISIRVSDAAAAKGAVIRLTDLQGRLVYQTRTGSEIQQEVDVPLQQMAPGIYLLQVSAGQASNSFKVVKK